MQDLENNLDGLFRQAVENYKVKTGESSWDKIEPRLLSNDVVPSEKKENDLKKYAKVLLLLLLFFFTVDINPKYNLNHEDVIGPPQKNENKNLRQTITNTRKEGKEEKLSNVNFYSDNTKVKNGMLFQIDDLPESGIEHKIEIAPLSIVSLNNKTSTDKSIEKKEINREKFFPLFDTRNSTISEKIFQNKKINESEVVNKDSLAINIKSNTGKQHGVYVGLVSGVSFNTVKEQGMRKPGFDVGVIAGYYLNRKTSIEAGIFFDKKFYFSDGKYFSMDKVGSSMPSGTKILSLEGSSTLFEIPVKINYTISEKNKTSFFSSAGLSSFLMINEKNNYLTSMNGSTKKMTGSYKNTSGYVAAAVNFSIGYQYKFHKNKNIRIEPYLQIPLKGVGMGSLPVTSIGLHLGFSFSCCNK